MSAKGPLSSLSWVPRRGRPGSSGFPAIGPAIPGVVLRVLVAAVGAGLSWLVLPPQPAVLGAVVAVVAAAVPRAFLAWALMIALGVGLLAAGVPDAGDLRFHLVLVGIPLLHLLSVWSAEVPLAARVQLRVLARPGLRYLGVQVVCQLVATAALWAFAPGQRSFPVLVVVALVALVVAAGVAVRAIRAADVPADET